MKKLFLIAALMTGSLFAATRTAPAQPPAPTTVTASEHTQTADDTDELRKSCPAYAPKCCGALPSGCVNCVGMFDECP